MKFAKWMEYWSTKLDKNVVISTRILISDLEPKWWDFKITFTNFKITFSHSYLVVLFHLSICLSSVILSFETINVVTFNSKSRVYFIHRKLFTWDTLYWEVTSEIISFLKSQRFFTADISCGCKSLNYRQ